MDRRVSDLLFPFGLFLSTIRGMEHFYKNLDGWFDFEEVYARMVAVAPTYAHFVEVGAYKGKSACFMAVEISNSKKDINFDVIDTWEGSEEHLSGGIHESKDVIQRTLYDTFKRNVKPVAHLLTPIRGTSLDAVKRYRDASLDFVFIDAAHDYENVKADIIAWRPKVKSGGYLGGHDYNGLFPGVIQAVHELVEGFEVIGFSWLVQIK